jgi:hypothetical protein
MEAIKANKAALNKLISWSSSRYNESKKSDVIADIIFRVEKGEDCTVEYRAGVYSEGAHTGRYKSKWTGGAYTLEIKNGLATIRNEVSDVVVPNKEVLQLEKPVRNTYFIPAKTINHDVEKYGVPVGVFQVLNQDLHSFHVLFEGVVRHLAKSDCTVIDRDTVSFSEREDKHMAQDIDINRLPIAEIATLDYIRNPDREGTGGVYRGSPAFEALLSLAAGNDTAEIYRQYDEAWTAANLKDNFQPKIAILQYAENAGNRDRRFISMETLNDVLHEQPNCNNYELVYVRNAETTTETEAAKDRLNNRLFEEFNADTLRPRNYYGHSLSIGDVIVIVNDFNDRSAYFVDHGTDFIKLPDDFLSREMSAKIYNDLDIRQESILHDNIRRYEAENIVALTDEAMQNRHADISLYYPRIFEMADRRGAIMDMDELGYEPAQIDGFSDDFIMWRAKDNEQDTFGFDGWDAVRDFAADVKTLLSNYTIQELQDRANGDYTVIEYGNFDDRAVQTALRNSGFHIKNFELKDMVYMANFTYNGQDMQRAVMSQGGTLYVSAGSRIAGDLTRHDFTPEEARLFNEFEKEHRNIKPLIVEGSDNITVQGHTGTWYVIEGETIDGRNLFLLESEQHGDEAAALIVDEAGNLVLDDVYNGFDDYREYLESHPERAEERSFEVAQEYEPIPNRYYEPELNIDGTADELFIEARYGYVENPEALRRIAEILKQEGKDEEAERVGYMAEKENEDTSLYSVAQMKLDFMDGQYTGVDDVAISEGLNLSVIYETRDNAVIVSLSRLDVEDDANVLYTGTASMTFEEFKAMNRADFDRFVNEVNAYNMVEQERIEQDERTQEIIIDGHTCSQIDEWQSDNSSYVLGQDIEDGTFYYVRAAEGEETFEYEFDSQPSREDVESHHINFLSERDIDRQEAEYGADGSRAFPHLNDEPQERITLHIKYQEPVIMNGWQAETDTITFDSKESMEEFVSGNVAYDYLDNAIRKKDNEILLYAENANGDVIWGTKEEVNHGDNENLQVQSHKTFELVEIDETLPPKDQLKQRLENGIRGVIDSENFKNWLSTGGKLFYNNYSFRNAMLVWLQKPEASYVMGYEKWKDFGRNVGQGATGAKIFIPLMASEKYKGGLFRSIKGNLNEQLSKDPTLTEAVYRLGTSNLEFTMNRANHLVGFKVNGKEQQIFGSDDEAKRFIDRAIIGKVPTGYTVGTVFDAKDVIIPEYLWVRSGFTKEEIATDTKGNPIKNRKGETKIINTPERQARFQTDLDTTIAAKDPVKMQALFDACTAASERKGVPVSLASKENDKTLNDGSKGYFSRQFSEENPNGFIVIDESLEITEKCAVLLHEMGHADLHKNLEALAERMGEDKIPREMREVQAEATAYAVASTFGIETDTSSFNYLAIYARGFELQDFNKSLEVIYKEAQTLTADIKAELDIRGLNLDLTEKPKETLDKETLVTISTKYMDFAAEQGSNIQAALTELPSLVKQNINNPELMEVLKYQKANLDNRRADVEAMLTGIESLNKADTREQQDQFINILDTLMNRISGNSFAFENLSERYVVIAEQARGGLKVDFENDPKKTLEAMKKDYPTLAKLSEPQLQYVATSKFISREFVKLLRNNPQEFVDRVTERATLLPKVAAKNGTFVEVNYCEQWTDKPFFENGTLCSPKIAETIITGSEAQARGFRQEAERRGEYFPYTKCDMTIFTPSKDGGFISLNTRVEIGDGEQTSLKEHLEKECKRGTERKEILANFQEALTERANKNKIRVQDVHDRPQNAESPANEVIKEGNMTRGEWSEQIQDARAQVQEEAQEQAAEKSKSKNSRDRADE